MTNYKKNVIYIKSGDSKSNNVSEREHAISCRLACGPNDIECDILIIEVYNRRIK